MSRTLTLVIVDLGHGLQMYLYSSVNLFAVRMFRRHVFAFTLFVVVCCTTMDFFHDVNKVYFTLTRPP
jgi:hypothetical protein